MYRNDEISFSPRAVALADLPAPPGLGLSPNKQKHRHENIGASFTFNEIPIEMVHGWLGSF